MAASAEPVLHRLRNTYGPTWLASVRLEALPAPDFAEHAHSVLAVACRRRVGAWCTRPSGHRAQGLHQARGASADAAFIVHHGDDASILCGEDGRWIVDRHGRARD